MPNTCFVWSCQSKGNIAGISFHRDLNPANIDSKMGEGNVSSSNSAPSKSVTMSSADSAGLKGVQKRNRKLVKIFHTYASRNGWNNNQSAFQFFLSYRRLLLHHDIKKT
ncbi:uncharacterized protein [Leptinotarsa decemlineata]|uniref:uncharacterized protein n=1 Tax=Leptinotarsa decemlineata TaxID=7539 RepID=UPI003D30B969